MSARSPFGRRTPRPLRPYRSHLVARSGTVGPVEDRVPGAGPDGGVNPLATWPSAQYAWPHDCVPRRPPPLRSSVAGAPYDARFGERLMTMTPGALLDELAWRGLVHDSTDPAQLREHLESGRRRFYIGFDPTAPSLTIGNLLPMTLMIRG